LGTINFYRRFVSKAAKNQEVLHDILRGLKMTGKMPVEWMPQLEQAFQNCNNSLAKAILLAHSRTEVTITLIIDASDTTLGAGNKEWQSLA